MDELEIALRKDARYSVAKLKEGLAKSCADDILEVLINLEDGTCDYIELNPTLKEIAEADWFCFFGDFSFYDEDNSEPKPDPTRKTSFRQSALKAIENIKENFYKLKSATLTHKALKSNNTFIIKYMLEQMTMQVNLADTTLIPILEKIAVKDVYKSYFYKADIKTDCRLGALAFRVIDIINANTARGDHKGKFKFFIKTCSVCSSLPDDITVNTGRDERLPEALHQLTQMTGDNREGYYRCPGCHTYFNRIDLPQMYGSGNCDEERLVRLSLEESYLLDKGFQILD